MTINILHIYYHMKTDYKHKYSKYKNKYIDARMNQIGKGNKKEVYLIRHGETEWNRLGLGQGQEANIPLNDTGREQVRKTGLYLKKFRMASGPFDCLFASPMLRTKESAEIIKDVIGFNGDIEYDDVLKERKHGKLSGIEKTDPLLIKIREFEKQEKSIDPIERTIGYDKLIEKENELFDIGWESNFAIEKRIEPFIQKLIDSKCKKILVVGHGGLLLSLIRKIFKIIRVPEGSFDNGENCWISYITYDDTEGFRLMSPPNTEHLTLM
jgi:broad specificity phosphatase PhoE